MKEKLKQKLTHNLGLKILSVILAVFTWLIMVNVSNPLMTVTQTVPVEFINENVLTKAGLTYEPLGRNSVTVSYKIHVRDEARITANDFYAYADLAQLYDVTGAIPVQVDLPSYNARTMVNTSTVTVNPSVIRIQTEPIQTKAFSLQIQTTGTEAEGYDIGEVNLSPAGISATGAESLIGLISSVGVEIDVSGIDADTSGETAVYLYDANGNRLDLGDDVQLNHQQVSYHLTVLRVKDLPLDYLVSGTVAPGYRFTGVESEVRSVSVVGLPSALENRSTLVIGRGVLDVTGAAGDRQVEVNLEEFLPENLSLVGGQPTVVTVTLHVEQLETRQYDVNLDQMELTGENPDYEYVFADQTLKLRIRGLGEDLDTLSADRIRVSADLTDLEPGEHQIVLNVTLEDGFDFMGPAGLRVTIRDPAAEAETETETDSTEESGQEEDMDEVGSKPRTNESEAEAEDE